MPIAAAAYQVITRYDLMNHKLSALFAGGAGVSYSYDVAGRMLTETAGGLKPTSAYDAAGNRSGLTWPDSYAATYNYDADNHLTSVYEVGLAPPLASFSYDSLGRRGGGAAPGFTNVGVTNANGTSTSYVYDNADRLTSLGQNLRAVGTTSYAQTIALAYNPASQILSRTGSNSSVGYDYAGYQTATTGKTYDGLNRDATIGTLGTLPGGTACSTANPSYGYDGNGNLLYDGVRAACYDAENRLIFAAIPSASTTATLAYDPLGRLQTYQATVSGTATTTTFLYDGDRLTAEYNGGVLLRRYVHGVGADVPLVWSDYSSGPCTSRCWLHADNQGSIIAWTSGQGGPGGTVIASYGAYGEPSSWSGSRFSYTGQIMLPEIRLYHYKARVYDPMVGRFLQTDPVGYTSDVDLYAYVGDDPVDRNDPTGLYEGWDDAGAIIGGSLIGGGIEVASQFSRGHGIRDWSRVGHAIVGGAVTGEATLYFGPAAGGAAGSAAEAALNGGSLKEIAVSGATGAMLSRLGGSAGEFVSSHLSIEAKGAVGEMLSMVKSALKGEVITGTQVKIPLSKSFTIADHTTSAHVVESKFGPSARLSPAQTRAQKELDNYRVDHWGPSDVGRITGAATGSAGCKASSKACN